MPCVRPDLLTWGRSSNLTIVAPFIAGAYTFRTCSDDGSNLFIGNDKVVDNDGLHGIQCREGTVNLASGDSMISVNFFENGGGASCKVVHLRNDGMLRLRCLNKTPAFCHVC